MKFCATIPVKPYVKSFLENNYGNPVNFNNYPRENEFFLKMLKKPTTDKDYMYQPDLSRYFTTVRIEISERTFYRYGWELSKTDNIVFGKHYERHAKMLMRTIVGTYVAFGMPINIAILRFQKRFNMREEDWSFETIVKDFFRYKTMHKIDFEHHAYEHLEELILINMYNAGVLSKSLMKDFYKTQCDSE